nr:hypothetical protein [Tanacetum cinerariifolium]
FILHQPSSHTHISSPSIPTVASVPTVPIPTVASVPTVPIPTVIPSETTSIRQYTRRARIAQSSALPPVADEPASPVRDVNQMEACPTDYGFIADQDRATIAKSSTLPHDSAPRVTSPAAEEGSMQQSINELTAFCTSLQRQHSVLLAKFQAQEVEINRLKERVQILEAKGGVIGDRSGDDAPIKRGVWMKGRKLKKDRCSTPAEGSVPTGSEEVPTASLVFATATVVARELEEQLAREDQRRAEQIARDAEIARIHAEKELQSMIDGLDSNNENIAKYLEEYRQFSSELPMEKRIELINDLVKYQDNYTKKSSEEITEEAKSPEEVTEEKIKEMMQLVLIEEVYVEALQVKHPIIDWEVHTEVQRAYWKIKSKETHSKRPATSDKEMELWVELSRLYEPNVEDQLWTHTQNFMHAPAKWKLYDKCRVHPLTSKDKDIFMLVEKDYPIRKGLELVMICYKLQVENYSQMADDLVRKIYNIANSPREQGD